MKYYKKKKRPFSGRKRRLYGFKKKKTAKRRFFKKTAKVVNYVLRKQNEIKITTQSMALGVPTLAADAGSRYARCTVIVSDPEVVDEFPAIQQGTTRITRVGNKIVPTWYKVKLDFSFNQSK